MKAGDYKVEVAGSQAIFKQGKSSIQVPVTVEKNASNYRFTALEQENSKLQAIDLGGSNLKIVFAPVKTTGASAAAQ